MSERAKQDIRASILGADRPFRVLPGGGRTPPPGASTDSDDDPCPVTPLGDEDGLYHFLDSKGQKRKLSARQLSARADVISLFRGDDAWLRTNFPQRKDFPDPDDTSGKRMISRIVGFSVNAASDWLIRACSDQGLYGDHLQLRRSGIWRGEGGLPIVHCGDEVLIEGEWRPAGTRTGNQIWIAAPPTARPGVPCDNGVGQAFHDEIQRLWRFKHAGAPGLLLGFVGTGMLGTAARWRPNEFLCGEGGSGKTLLMDALRGACPMHTHSNDASAAGVSSAMNGHVMPIYIDESADRRDPSGAEALLDMVLASSSGEGTKGVRSLPDGRSRTIELAGCVLYGSVTPPPMLPTHMSRITMIELLRPEGGEDARAEQEALAAWARDHGPQLWGRVIESAERWHASLVSFRTRLAEVGCAAREMDQMGALLAGWWILTREGLPGDVGAREGVAMASEYIRSAEDAAEDGGPQRAVRHLLSHLVQYDGTTRQEQVGALLERWFDPTDQQTDRSVGFEALGRNGIRPVRPCLSFYEFRDPPAPPISQKYAPKEFRGWARRVTPIERPAGTDCGCANCLGRYRDPVPRLGEGGGVWLLPNVVNGIFRGVHGLEGDRWKMELLRSLCARSHGNVRVGGVAGKAIWLPREAFDDGSG